MEIYRKRKHDIIFDTFDHRHPWWACRGCKARGPELNKHDCTHPSTDQGMDDDEDKDEKPELNKHGDIYPMNDQEKDEDDDKDEHRNKRRKKSDKHQSVEDEDERKYGTVANKEARYRAKELQEIINQERIKTNIAAHQEDIHFTLPYPQDTLCNTTDEQTNHCFFEGKETRKKAMLKAKNVQMDKFRKKEIIQTKKRQESHNRDIEYKKEQDQAADQGLQDKEIAYRQKQEHLADHEHKDDTMEAINRESISVLNPSQTGIEAENQQKVLTHIKMYQNNIDEKVNNDKRTMENQDSKTKGIHFLFRQKTKDHWESSPGY
jgi:hypothetical protein